MLCFTSLLLQVNVNHLIQTFFTACTSGYIGSFISEIVVATGIKLAAFHYLEPGLEASCPEIPAIHLPWVWKEQCGGYRPRLYTLLLADLAVNCVASPIIEETIKLWCYRWCSWIRIPWIYRQPNLNDLSSNSNADQASAAGGSSSQDPQQASTSQSGPQPQVPQSRRPRLPRYYRRADTVHSTLVYMMAAALGLKAADNARRILLYTKPQVRTGRKPERKATSSLLIFPFTYLRIHPSTSLLWLVVSSQCMSYVAPSPLSIWLVEIS